MLECSSRVEGHVLGMADEKKREGRGRGRGRQDGLDWRLSWPESARRACLKELVALATSQGCMAGWWGWRGG